MNKQNLAIGLAVVAILGVAYIGFSLTSKGGLDGAINAEDYIPVIKYEGYNSAKPITLSGASGDITTGDDLIVTDDATVSGGNLTVTTSNSATSTISLGCIQTVATSTATPIALTFSTIATTTTMANGQSNNGYVLWKYGSCPF